MIPTETPDINDGESQAEIPREPWVLRSAWRLYGSLFLLLAIPTALLVFSIALHVRSQLESDLRGQNQLLSRLLSVAIDEEMSGLKSHVSSVATRQLLRESILANDTICVTAHLESLVQNNPKITRAFVTDPEGIERFDFPHDPTVIGADFSHRDWFEGVVAVNGTYVSEIYQRAALGQPFVVSVAAPVRDTEGTVIGYLVSQYPLRDLQARMAALTPTESVTFAIIDQSGHIASAATEAPLLDAEQEPALPKGLDLARLGSQVVTLDGGKEHLFSISPISAPGWKAVAHRSMESVTGPVQSLLTTIGVLFVAAFAGTGLFGGMLMRTLWRYNVALRRADTALRLAKIAAEDANATKSEFLANMSHEIRTPMMAIIGYTDLLTDPSRTQDERLDAVRVIRRNSHHLLTIINDILDLSKIEAGEMHIERVECSPCRVLYEVFSLMRVRASEKGLEFKTRVEGVIPETIHCDPTRLRQILINLVGNAIKFTDSGWVRITTHLIEPDGGGKPTLRFDVADTGIGMNEEQQSRLFRPFAQADSSTTRRFGGTGLGLAICDRLSRMLGGRIEVQSCPDRGSTFSLFIATGPLSGVRRLRDCREAILEQELGDRAAAQSVRLAARILLVEDGKDNRALLSLYLRIAGAEVVEAENGKIACDLVEESAARRESFDAIILDMQMPVLDGYSAAQRMRESGFNNPIIALTAHAMAQDRARCLSAGCTDYLSKPVTQHDLLHTLARHVRTIDPGEADGRAAASPPTAAPAGSKFLAAKEALISCLSDEACRPYLEAFIDGLPSRAAELQEHLASRDLKALSDLVHQIKGSGGLFGFMPITQQAVVVEEVIQCGRSIEAIHAEIAQLIGLLERVRRAPVSKAPVSPRPASA